MPPNTTSTEQLAAMVAAKLQVLKVLVQLTRRQVALIEAGEMSTLIKLLAAKQTVISQLQVLEQELTPFRGEDPEKREWKSPLQRAACQAQAQYANTLLAETLQLEQQAESKMLRRRDAAAAALSAVQTASDARAAYATIPAAGINSLQVEG